jgi:hypothetical protein
VVSTVRLLTAATTWLRSRRSIVRLVAPLGLGPCPASLWRPDSGERQRPPVGGLASIREDRLLGPDGRVWPALLRLWTYSTLAGVLAVGIGHLMVSVTDTVLPALPVRLGSIIAVVAVAGLAAEAVLSYFDHLERSLRVHVEHYNRHRPHRALSLTHQIHPTLPRSARNTQADCIDGTCSAV